MAYQRSPSEQPNNDDLFRNRLDQMIDMRHELVKLAHVMPWETLLNNMQHLLPAVPVGRGQRPLPARLMLGLLYLKYTYNLSDENVSWRNAGTNHCCRQATFIKANAKV